jgi:hypothetical protein
MSPQRIKTGFHRIGLVIAVAFGVVGALLILASVPFFFGWIPGPGRALEMGLGALGFGLGNIALGALAYVAARALGWIIAGFAGDGENPN